MREISERGLMLVKEFEDLRLREYTDAVGVRTIGYGHRVKPRERFGLITPERAEELLKADLKVAETAVETLVQVPLSDNEFSALVSLVFNIGVGNFDDSTLLKRLNEREYVLAADQFRVWNKGRVKGKLVALRGLTRRREAERQLFLS